VEEAYAGRFGDMSAAHQVNLLASLKGSDNVDSTYLQVASHFLLTRGGSRGGRRCCRFGDGTGVQGSLQWLLQLQASDDDGFISGGKFHFHSLDSTSGAIVVKDDPDSLYSDGRTCRLSQRTATFLLESGSQEVFNLFDGLVRAWQTLQVVLVWHPF
jgi:hypothetical protein